MTTDDKKIRVRAEDAQDLAVIAAFLQDARISVREMAYDPEEGRFMAAFARYRREFPHDEKTCAGLTETDCVLTFECIKEVKQRNMIETAMDAEMPLLTIATEPGEQRLFHIDFVFSEGREVQLRSDCIDCRLEDVGEPRDCRQTPCDHFLDDLAAGRAERAAEA